ncbi:hypothetical protein BX666DRAFT_2090507 [Dichotomocladium elegans]|nr:hypothetical protein BX666DRAFT_2090507 [Dichotomocladium elegans]
MIGRIALTGALIRDVEYPSTPRMQQGTITLGVYARFTINWDGHYFNVYASQPSHISWLLNNNVRAGSSVIVNGRFKIRNYTTSRGSRGVSYSITLEQIALAVEVEITLGRRVAGERPADSEATTASITQQLRQRGLVTTTITDQFVNDLQAANDDEQSVFFVERFLEKFPCSVLGLVDSVARALALQVPKEMRTSLLFHQPSEVSVPQFRRFLSNTSIVFDTARLTESLIASFIAEMWIQPTESTSIATTTTTTTTTTTSEMEI